MRVVDHQLAGAEIFRSPHHDDRPASEISLIVVHGISLPPGQFGGNEIAQLFMGNLDTRPASLNDLEGVRVSSHVVIRRDGNVQQFVDFDRRAWHAGESVYRGRDNCNDFAIGIELEGTDQLPYEAVQYFQLARVCSTLMNHYGVTDVVGHCHVAPGRKTDPGDSFDWSRFKRLLAASL